MNWRSLKKPSLLSTSLTAVLFVISLASGNLVGLRENAVLTFAFINGLIISAISLSCRAQDKIGNGEKSIILTILADYRINRFSAINIITFLNSFMIGFLLGASFYLLLLGVASYPLFYTFQGKYGYEFWSQITIIRQYIFGGSLLLLLLTVPIRISSEVNILLFRVAQKYLSE